MSGLKTGSESGNRAGTRALSLLGEPLHVAILDALADQPKSHLDVVRAAGSPPQTTVRARLRALAEIGVLDRRRQNEFPGAIDFDLTAAGRDLRSVAATVRTWLGKRPEGPVDLGTVAAKSAIKALVEAWETGMIRALAARPLSLTELDRVIADVSYPTLERRLSALRLAGQISRTAGSGRGGAYEATPWLRQAVVPLATAVCWEHRHLPSGPLITNRDAEAALLLTLPLVRLEQDLSGGCRLAVEMPFAGRRRLAGVLVELERGRVVSCSPRLSGNAAAWACGSAGDWLQAIVRRERDRLKLGGASDLARALLDGLHQAMVAPRRSDRDLRTHHLS